MAVTAHQDLNPRPAGANAANHMAQHGGDLDTIRRLAGTQDGCHRLAALRFVDMHRQKAMTVVMGVEQRQLLTAVHRILGIVDIEHDA
jgi:hypothetical protein